MTELAAQELCKKAGIAWHEAGDADALAEQLAKDVALSLQQQIVATGAASLVVSGGSTPAPVFSRLAQSAIDWPKVSVTLADERWVPPGHADSNESLVRDTLLVGKAAEAQFVSLYREGVLPEEAAPMVARDVRNMPHPFTVTILGMGTDGHTASLFPDAPATELNQAMALDNNRDVAIMNPPSVSQARITLTRVALLASQRRILHITGEAKQQVLAQALEHAFASGHTPDIYAPPLKPIVGLLATQPHTAMVYWSR